MSAYRNNHYVPIWYQERFLDETQREKKFFYLDLNPEAVTRGGRRWTRNDLLRWGPSSCFCQRDLYTTRGPDWLSTEIEEKFFGPIDASARPALDFFASFQHPSVNGKLMQDLLRYMSIQKLRTVKGLKFLSQLTQMRPGNRLLYELQEIQAMFCAIWAESVWTIADVSDSGRSVLLSDHPVTVYNCAYPPGAWECRSGRDPHIWQSGTHTIFPLNSKKLLILTNLSWVRNPYSNPRRNRPNPDLFRPTVFNFLSIQTGRILSESDVIKINYIIKQRANRYVASSQERELYPERELSRIQWDSISKEYVLMPDPRSVTFSGETRIGFVNGGGAAFDAYGRTPWQPGFSDPRAAERERESFYAFKGEYSRLFGPQRRGRAFELGRLSPEVDDAEHHQYHLGLERGHRKRRYNGR